MNYFSSNKLSEKKDTCSTCSCQLPRNKLVVDVHQGVADVQRQGGAGGTGGDKEAAGGGVRQCSKHQTDRVQGQSQVRQCNTGHTGHSESDRHLQRSNQLDNCDR